MTYRDEDAAARAELTELEAELERVGKEHDELSQRIEKRRAEEARIARLKHPAWGAPGALLTIGILLLATHSTCNRLEDSQPKTLDPDVGRLRDELWRARMEKRQLDDAIAKTHVDNRRDIRAQAVVTAMRSLDAREEREAWQIVAWAACMRGDWTLYEGARQRSGDAGGTRLENCRTIEGAAR